MLLVLLLLLDGRVRHVKKVGEEIPEQPREGKHVKCDIPKT